ncbi:MAG: phosphoadenylyl-sulfate reductase [Bacteroidales bacterium]|nr:phosphoadenylyl-sulfate reductase [Bacteroidales bacterium]
MEDTLNATLAASLEKETADKKAWEILQLLAERYKGSISFSSSFGIEDQVITDIIYSHNLPVRIFTLDTGRHFEETYKVHSRTLAQYGKKIQVYHPDHLKIEELLTEKGPYSFYESIENREYCCQIRKVEPLQRALANVSIWITGIRKEQSSDRELLSKFMYDPGHKLIKFNPLLDWTLEEVNHYIKAHHVPYNVLHDNGFTSIGCAPCTRAIEPGQSNRAGRWWWENNASKECGIHTNGNEK